MALFILDNNAYVWYNGKIHNNALKGGYKLMKGNRPRSGLSGWIFGVLFAVMGVMGLLGNVMLSSEAYAEPSDEVTSSEAEENEIVNVDDGSERREEPEVVVEEQTNNNTTRATIGTKNGCKNSLGDTGWFACSVTQKIAEAVDWLYDKIEVFLAINPVEASDKSPIYTIWKYCLGLTNIAFVVFLMVVVVSQISGIGISNYGIKKVLPKILVAAVMVNLSFLICSVAVDISNVIGNGLRGVFESVEDAAVAGMADSGTDMELQTKISNANMFGAIAGGTALAIGGTLIAFETGAIWMFIPTILAAIVAVVVGLITIAMRQALVVLLVMISPIAIVCYMLPNTEGIFSKWKKLFIQMLVFYPMFSLLFGASSLAGFAIIASATDGFGVILGTAVQIFPLFFAWTLMKMSGTILGAVSTRMNGFAGRPRSGLAAWADMHRQSTKMKNLANPNPYTPSLRLMQFMSNRKFSRGAEMFENAELVKKRGLAYRANSHYRGDDSISKKGEDAYRKQAEGAEYERIALRDKNNLSKGYGGVSGAARDVAQKARLERLDQLNMDNFDALKTEQARTEKIDFDNAKGFYKRTEDAINANQDLADGFTVDDNGNRVMKTNYKFHSDPNAIEGSEAMARYRRMAKAMDNNPVDIQFAAATAAQSYSTQMKSISGRFQTFYDLLPPSKDLEYRLEKLTMRRDAADNIDSIIAGLKIVNLRGDTDVVKRQIDNMLEIGGIELGTHASQALASFLMFDVKDSDPALRRFGKYLNLETARVYNSNDRKELRVTYDEYVRGYHYEPDPNDSSRVKKMYAKKSMADLMEGTPLDNVERTAFSNLDESLMKAYTDSGGHFDFDAYTKKRAEVQKAMGASFISASSKYIAGSEQLKSAVAFLTGYTYGQVKDPITKEVMTANNEPVYAWQAIWDDAKTFGDRSDDAKKFYRERTKQYIQDLTPNLVLGMRSDYRDPLMEHLTDMFLDESPEKEEYAKKISDIQTKYGDLPADEAKKKRDDDMKKLKMEMAGKQFRKILGETGKLEQIYATRRSGAANNAKDWLREWVNLDNEDELREEVARIKQKRREEYEEQRRERQQQQDPDDQERAQRAIYTDADVEYYSSEMERICEQNNDEETDEYFTVTRDKLAEWFGKEDYIVWSYEKYHQNNAYVDNEDLHEWLMATLENLEDYPGNRGF